MVRWVWRLVGATVLIAALCWAQSRPLGAGPVWEDRWDWGPETSPLGLRQLAPWTLAHQAGQSPIAIRSVNLALHVVVGALVYLLLCSVGASEGAAWAGTATFLLNAVATQALAYVVSGRAEMLAAAAVLAACLLWIGRYRTLAIALLIVGLTAKQSAVVGVALLPLVVAARARPGPSWAEAFEAARAGVWPVVRPLVRRPLLAVVTAVGLVLVVGGGAGNRLDPSYEVTWIAWAGTQAAATYRLWTTSLVPIWPLAVDWDYRLPLPALVACGAILAMTAVVGWHCWSSAPLLGLALLWPIIAVGPRLALQTPHSELNEHQWYLPMVGIAFLIAWAWEWLTRDEDWLWRTSEWRTG
jgi:hypothetical protein